MKIKIKDGNIYAPLLGKWVLCTQEEELKQKFILELVEKYGYSLNQLGQDIQIKRRFKADVAIWKNADEKNKKKKPSIIVAVECKAEHITIKKEDYLTGLKFAEAVEADFFIAKNLKQTKVFHIPEFSSETPQLDYLKDIPKASIIKSNSQIKKFINETKKFTRDEFSKLLFKCHNIIRNNDKLSPEAAFDEISKILFMKILHERNNNTEMLFSKDVFLRDEQKYEKTIRPSLEISAPHAAKDYMQYLFDETKREYQQDELFEATDQIKLKRMSFESIVTELEKFNLSATSDDIKGLAFEEFLGKTFRGELGQFFTPRTLVDYMVEVLDPQENELICDPCCGSGGFLIKVFDYIREKIELSIKKEKTKVRKIIRGKTFDKKTSDEQNKIKQKENKLFIQLDKEFDLQNKKGRLYNLSHKCIYGTDANPRMARTAKMNMIMHGDGHGGVHHNDGLLNINGIFEERFDVILTNPPFGSRISRNLRVSLADIPNEGKIEIYKNKYPQYEEKVVKPLKEWIEFTDTKGNKGKPIIDLFDTGKMGRGLSEILFIERCLNLLKPGGRMGIVLPDGVLSGIQLEKVRDYVESKAKIINITSIPKDVFIASGANVKPSIIFFKKFTADEKKLYHKIMEKATVTANEKFQTELDELNNGFEKQRDHFKYNKDKEGLKKLRQKYKFDLKLINNRIESEIKSFFKREFDYPIPIIKVEKAGISSTGASCENELIEVAKEFGSYRKEVKLWEYSKDEISYHLNGSEKIMRVVGNGKPLSFYG